jgi:hypothetical protein
MHAALISLVLMSGACGDNPPEAIDAVPIEAIPPCAPPPPVTISEPPISNWHGCVGCGNGPVPQLYQGCPQYQPSEYRTQPAWNTNYHPALYFYPLHRMLFHPADYTQPYPYRERFNYPWNDPRCPCAVPPIGY